MNTKTLKKAGIYFDYCRFAVVPEIPYVQDVLYALQLSDKQKNYDFCHGNHATYIANVGLVIAAVGCRVLGMEFYDEAEARKIIAEAIIELCPPEAKCLFNLAFVKAKIAAGYEGWQAVLNRDGEILRKTCLCLDCRREESRRTAAY